MLNKYKLIEAIDKRGLNQKMVAEKIGMTESKFSNRINGKFAFQLRDIVAIKIALDLSLTEFDEIFMNEEVK